MVNLKDLHKCIHFKIQFAQLVLTVEKCAEVGTFYQVAPKLDIAKARGGGAVEH